MYLTFDARTVSGFFLLETLLRIAELKVYEFVFYGISKYNRHVVKSHLVQVEDQWGFFCLAFNRNGVLRFFKDIGIGISIACLVNKDVGIVDRQGVDLHFIF